MKTAVPQVIATEKNKNQHIFHYLKLSIQPERSLRLQHLKHGICERTRLPAGNYVSQQIRMVFGVRTPFFQPQHTDIT